MRVIQSLSEDQNCQSLPQNFILDNGTSDHNHSIEIESMETIFQKYNIVSLWPDKFPSCFLITLFTKGSIPPRIGVKLYDIVLFPQKNQLSGCFQSSGWYYHCCGSDNKDQDLEYHFTFSTLGENDSTFLFHDPKKSPTSLSILRYPILTQLIESHVTKPNDIVYNNANQPLKFEDVLSLEKYHSIIFSKVNAMEYEP